MPARRKATADPAVPTFTGRRKIAIVGYTTSANEAPYGDPEWEIWGMNDLYTVRRKSMDFEAAYDAGHFHAWFDLHRLDKKYEADKGAHVAWLKTQRRMPVIVWDADGLPENCVAYPRDAMVERFGGYFTNTVSWQLAMAITMLEGVPDAEIAIYGVNMSVGVEYSAQKPSVEFFIGLARGMGIPVFIPVGSDLLKAAALYGAEEDEDGVRLRIRQQELRDQHEEVLGQIDHLMMVRYKVEGALEQVDYQLKTMHQPEAKRPQID